MDRMTEQLIIWIKSGLKRTGKTQSGLAEHLGIAHPQITQILKGSRAVKVSELPKIAEFIESRSPVNFDEDATISLQIIPADNLTPRQIEEVKSFIGFIRARDQ